MRPSPAAALCTVRCAGGAELGETGPRCTDTGGSPLYRVVPVLEGALLHSMPVSPPVERLRLMTPKLATIASPTCHMWHYGRPGPLAI